MEKELHINILEMKVAQLTLNASIGESLVLMGNSGTAVAFLKTQRGTVSLNMSRLTQEMIIWSELCMVTITEGTYLGRRMFMLIG